MKSYRVARLFTIPRKKHTPKNSCVWVREQRQTSPFLLLEHSAFSSHVIRIERDTQIERATHPQPLVSGFKFSLSQAHTFQNTLLALWTHRLQLPPPPPPHPALPLLIRPLPGNDLALSSLISTISPNAPWRSSARTASALATSWRGLPELGELIRGRSRGLIAVGVGVVDGRIKGGRGGDWEPWQWYRCG